MYFSFFLILCALYPVDSFVVSGSIRHPFSINSGLDERDAAFMQRLRNLAQEALTWPHLGERQRLVWAAALELHAVPFQELLDQLWCRDGGMEAVDSQGVDNLNRRVLEYIVF